MGTKGILWVCGGLTLLTVLAWSSFFWVIQEDKKTLQEANTTIQQGQAINNTCSITRDSLMRENAELSQFKTLTQAMVHRDAVTSQLKHKVGEMVFMKSDSAKVVIEDVLIGGSKYNYYVKFRVLYKDQSTKEVIPELIY